MDNERRIVAHTKRHPKDFLKLYDHYYPKLYAYVLSRVRHREYAEDVVSSAFMKALANIGKFRWKRSATFGSWLFRIAKNEMVDQLRKDSKVTVTETVMLERVTELIPDASEILIEQEIDSEQRCRLNKVLESMDSLNELEQEIISLKYFSNLSYKEISTITGKKPNTLAVALRRALNKIRKDLDV